MPGAFLYEPNSGILDMNYDSSYESIRLRRGKLVKNKKSILRKLFFSCLYLSTFTFGGGYVIVTLMKKKFVDDYQWIDEKEMLDLVAIAQSSPGPIAVNGAIVVGYKLAGILGAMTAILGTIIPPFLIISVISAGYHSFTMKQKLPGSQKKRKLPLIKLLIVYFELNWQAYAATIGASQPSVFNFFRYAFILRSLLN